MNNILKILINKITNFIICIYLACFCSLSIANPEGGKVVSGTATITSQPNVVKIDQATNKAIINWQSFNINANESTIFNVPDAASVTLNRINGIEASSIYGQLQSNGRLFLLNSAGLHFGPNSKVDVAGIIASTLNISNEDFNAGRYIFTKDNKYISSIINEGTINASDKGFVGLIAPVIDNKGVINAQVGKVMLASGKHVTFDIVGDGFINFAISPNNKLFNSSDEEVSSSITNDGKISAPGGQIILKAESLENVLDSMINMSGYVDVSTIKDLGNGELVLIGQNGLNENAIGNIDIKSNHVKIDQDSKINANGQVNGGEINILASKSIDSKGDISANGNINGGKILLQSDQELITSGNFFANGLQGVGGFIDLTGQSLRTLSANFNASGLTGGGRIRLGGDYLGGKEINFSAGNSNLLNLFKNRWNSIHLENTELLNSNYVFVDEGTKINANTLGESGDGGTVVIWGNEIASALGKISVLPGSISGNGGGIETSSGNFLKMGASVYTGIGDRKGTFLLDPRNVDIVAGGTWDYVTDGLVDFGQNLPPPPGPVDLTVDGSQLVQALNNGTDVIVRACNDLTLNYAVNSTGTGAFELYSGRSMTLNQNISHNGNFKAYANVDVGGGGAGGPDGYRTAGDATISATGSVINIGGTGSIDIQMQDGGTNSNNSTGIIDLSTLSTNSGDITITHNGTDTSPPGGNHGIYFGAGTGITSGGNLTINPNNTLGGIIGLIGGAGNTVTAAGNINFGGKVSAGGNASVESTGGGITFNGIVTPEDGGVHNLTVKAPSTQDITFNGGITNELVSFTNFTIQRANDVTFNDAVEVQTMTLGAQGITGTVAFNNNVNFTTGLTVSSQATPEAFNLTFAGASNTITGNTDFYNTGNVTFTGASNTITGNANFYNNTGNVTFGGDLNRITGDTDFYNTGNVTFTGALSEITGFTNFYNLGTLTLGNAAGDTFDFMEGFDASSTSMVNLVGNLSTSNLPYTYTFSRLNMQSNLAINSGNAATSSIIINEVVSNGYTLTLTAGTIAPIPEPNYKIDIGSFTGNGDLTVNNTYRARLNSTAGTNSQYGTVTLNTITTDAVFERSMTINTQLVVTDLGPGPAPNPSVNHVKVGGIVGDTAHTVYIATPTTTPQVYTTFNDLTFDSYGTNGITIEKGYTVTGTHYTGGDITVTGSSMFVQDLEALRSTDVNCSEIEVWNNIQGQGPGTSLNMAGNSLDVEGTTTNIGSFTVDMQSSALFEGNVNVANLNVEGNIIGGAGDFYTTGDMRLSANVINTDFISTQGTITFGGYVTDMQGIVNGQRVFSKSEFVQLGYIIIEPGANIDNFVPVGDQNEVQESRYKNRLAGINLFGSSEDEEEEEEIFELLAEGDSEEKEKEKKKKQLEAGEEDTFQYEDQEEGTGETADEDKSEGTSEDTEGDQGAQTEGTTEEEKTDDEEKAKEDESKKEEDEDKKDEDKEDEDKQDEDKEDEEKEEEDCPDSEKDESGKCITS